MIDRNPVEIGAEVALRVLHQLSREGPKVSDLARVLWGDCEHEPGWPRVPNRQCKVVRYQSSANFRFRSLAVLRCHMLSDRARSVGEVPERSNGAVSKTVVPLTGDRGFESLPLRQPFKGQGKTSRLRANVPPVPHRLRLVLPVR